MSKPIIKELWMLWNVETEDWLLSFDDPAPHYAYLCTTSKEAAICLQKHQKKYYEVKSVPVRVI